MLYVAALLPVWGQQPQTIANSVHVDRYVLVCLCLCLFVRNYVRVCVVCCVCVMHVYVSVVARYSDDIITLSACDALLLTLKKEIDVMTNWLRRSFPKIASKKHRKIGGASHDYLDLVHISRGTGGCVDANCPNLWENSGKDQPAPPTVTCKSPWKSQSESSYLFKI